MTELLYRADRFMTRHFTRPSITWRQAVTIVIPLIAENLFNTLFGLLNTGMISSSGVTSLSAVSLVDTLNTFLFVFYTGIATGACVVVANYRGKGGEAKLHEAMVQAVTSVTLFTIVTAAFVIAFNRPLLNMLFGSAEQEVMDKALLYMLGGAVILPLLGIATATCGVLRGIGEGRISLVYTMISTGVYVLLNLLFLTILKMGIPGLILSISINRVSNIPLLLFLMKKGHSAFRAKFKEFFHINFKMLGSILKIGLPCAMEQLFFTGGRLVTQSMIVPMGTNAIVTYNVSYSIMTLSQCLVSPVNTAMFTVAGICMGNNRPEDVRSLTKSYFALNTCSYVFSLGMILVLFRSLVRFYNAPAELVSEIFLYVMITTVSQPIIHNAAFMLPSVFRAVGDGNYCTVVSLLIMWIVRVGGGYVLGVWMGMGVLGIWIAMDLDWLVRALIFPIRFRGTKWLEHRPITD